MAVTQLVRTPDLGLSVVTTGTAQPSRPARETTPERARHAAGSPRRNLPPGVMFIGLYCLLIAHGIFVELLPVRVGIYLEAAVLATLMTGVFAAATVGGPREQRTVRGAHSTASAPSPTTSPATDGGPGTHGTGGAW